MKTLVNVARVILVHKQPRKPTRKAFAAIYKKIVSGSGFVTQSFVAKYMKPIILRNKKLYCTCTYSSLQSKSKVIHTTGPFHLTVPCYLRKNLFSEFYVKKTYQMKSLMKSFRPLNTASFETFCKRI